MRKEELIKILESSLDKKIRGYSVVSSQTMVALLIKSEKAEESFDELKKTTREILKKVDLVIQGTESLRELSAKLNKSDQVEETKEKVKGKNIESSENNAEVKESIDTTKSWAEDTVKKSKEYTKKQLQELGRSVKSEVKGLVKEKKAVSLKEFLAFSAIIALLGNIKSIAAPVKEKFDELKKELDPFIRMGHDLYTKTSSFFEDIAKQEWFQKIQGAVSNFSVFLGKELYKIPFVRRIVDKYFGDRLGFDEGTLGASLDSSKPIHENTLNIKEARGLSRLFRESAKSVDKNDEKLLNISRSRRGGDIKSIWNDINEQFWKGLKDESRDVLADALGFELGENKELPSDPITIAKVVSSFGNKDYYELAENIAKLYDKSSLQDVISSRGALSSKVKEEPIAEATNEPLINQVPIINEDEGEEIYTNESTELVDGENPSEEYIRTISESTKKEETPQNNIIANTQIYQNLGTVDRNYNPYKSGNLF